MSGEPAGATFTLKRVQQMLGLSRAVVDGLIGAGFVSRARGRRNEYRFSFRDLMLLRTAHSLQSAKIPPRKLLRAQLASLQARLPAELPLTGLRLTAIGADAVVGDRLGPWEADSGQLIMDFEVTTVGSDGVFMVPAPPSRSAEQWFLQGQAVEDLDAAAAEVAYRQAIDRS